MAQTVKLGDFFLKLIIKKNLTYIQYVRHVELKEVSKGKLKLEILKQVVAFLERDSS